MSITYIVAFVNLAVFMLGCWEAYRASENEPTLHTSPGEKQGYAFAVICAFVNIAGSIILTCSMLIKNEKKEKEDYHGCLPQCALFIWCCFLFAGIFNDDIRTGPFQDVVVAQFYFMMTSLGLACCLGCCGACGMMCKKPEPEATTNPVITVEV
jgi:hypothetical protein